jgi:hypothetical protein
MERYLQRTWWFVLEGRSLEISIHRKVDLVALTLQDIVE